MIIFASILTLLNRVLLLEAAGAVVLIASKLKSIHHHQIKLAQIRERMYKSMFLNHYELRFLNTIGSTLMCLKLIV